MPPPSAAAEPPSPTPPPEPKDSARAAGLRYVEDEPGYTRLRWGKGFTYRDPQGETVRDPDLRRRFEDLVIPPAWTEVWICRDQRGHIQATGRDDAGRKQYIYHPRWREVRDRTKFDRLLAFGRALPVLRAEVDRQLRRRNLDREKVLALVVRLLETSCIRVGNDEYRRSNRSFGLTTLRRRHVEVGSTRIRFHFRGKGGAEHDVAVSDRRLARAVRRCEGLPGQELFQYLDEEGRRHPVDSGEVNAFLREVTGQPFTAKDFRTWMGSVHALRFLHQVGPPANEDEAASRSLEAVDRVCGELRNTREVCREFYVHPAILMGYREGWLFEVVGEEAPVEAPEHLDVEEVSLLRLLEHLDGD